MAPFPSVGAGLAPDTFGRDGGQSAVHSQPSSPDAEFQALRAAAACPTSSIRTSVPNAGAAAAASSFPLPAPGLTPGSVVEDVFFNGSASEASYGSASWLVLNRGPDGFAVMVDVPRFSRPLLRAIEAAAAPVGAVRYIVLTHMDDVANHERWAKALGAERIIHKADVRRSQRTDECEHQFADAEFPHALGEGIQLIHVPGHTRGSITLLHRPSKSLFTGDHIFYSARQGVLAGNSTYCSHSFDEQIRNVEALRDVPFLHGFPGHGRHFHFKDAEDRIAQLSKSAEFMRGGHPSSRLVGVASWEQLV